MKFSIFLFSFLMSLNTWAIVKTYSCEMTYVYNSTRCRHARTVTLDSNGSGVTNPPRAVSLYPSYGAGCWWGNQFHAFLDLEGNLGTELSIHGPGTYNYLAGAYGLPASTVAATGQRLNYNGASSEYFTVICK